MQALVEHTREGVRWIKPDRGQDRHHFALEKIAYPLPLRFIPGRAGEKANAFLRQRGQNDFVQQSVLFLDDGVRFSGDQTKGLLRGLAIDGGERHL